MKNLIKFKKETGEVLIEAIIALAITTLIITGLVVTVISSLNNSTYIEIQNQASGYAQEGLDVARNLKESDYNSFSGLSGTYCLGKDIKTIDEGNACDQIDEKFTRKIYINQSGVDPRGPIQEVACSSGNGSIFVASTASWNDTKCSSSADCHKVELDSCFTNLNQIQKP